ncbi:hypothetical protein NHQ30_007497 [Ciborinia camelliae]|nr:hypothetical protein NHQ30_007497 [Ciborinia camelliae]
MDRIFGIELHHWTKSRLVIALLIIRAWPRPNPTSLKSDLATTLKALEATCEPTIAADIVVGMRLMLESERNRRVQTQLERFRRRAVVPVNTVGGSETTEIPGASPNQTTPTGTGTNAIICLRSHASANDVPLDSGTGNHVPQAETNLVSMTGSMENEQAWNREREELNERERRLEGSEQAWNRERGVERDGSYSGENHRRYGGRAEGKREDPDTPVGGKDQRYGIYPGSAGRV